MLVKKERRRSETAKLLQMVLKWRMKNVGNQRRGIGVSLYLLTKREGK